MTLDAVIAQGFAPAAEAITAGRIPGAVLGVVTADGRRAIQAAGLAQRVPESRAMTADTWFDLASVTKVIATTTEILRLVQEGIVDLDDPLSRHLPDFRQYDVGCALRRTTIRQCLSHQTTLPGVEPIYTWGSDPETLKALILQKDWASLPTPVYSDINFMLLGFVIERRRGVSLAELPRGKGLSFLPKGKDFAATESCAWRRRVIAGEVHDENAFSLGGFAGHAGLFGTAEGVLGFAHEILTAKALSAASIAEMRRPQSATRGLGWERRYDGWSGGTLCSPATLGHTGFTGTGLWIDFDRGYAWTLLTNRVHPTRHVETGIQDLRRATGNRLAAAYPY
jgi:CubicO group peptidase (beta-lactamase class C family)